jgi:hypothetical protein
MQQRKGVKSGRNGDRTTRDLIENVLAPTNSSADLDGPTGRG